MNKRSSQRSGLALLVLVVLTLAACDLLPAGALPTAPPTEPAPLPKVTQPAPTQTPEALSTTSVSVAATLVAPTPVNLPEEVAPDPTAPATAGLQPPVDHKDEATGISFTLPPGWTVKEEPNAYIFRIGTVTLLVTYRSIGEQTDIWRRTGIPAGDVVLLDGPVPFLGQQLTRNALIYEDNLKMVFYGGPPASIVESETMDFVIILEDRESDYLTINIPDEVLAGAEAILASSTFINLRPP